jgi:hypothetical protein
MIGCFDFILNLCVFLKRMRCQLVTGGQKTPPFCHDRMAATLFWLFYLPELLLCGCGRKWGVFATNKKLPPNPTLLN